jgi:hypothetical protein
VSVAARAPARLEWWEGDGSPGVLGYVLADLKAVGALALVMPLFSGFSDGFLAYPIEFVVVGFFAFLYSIPLAAVGIPVVHFSCLRVRSQAVHVLAAGLVGVAAGVVPIVALGGGLDLVPGLFLGAATAVGRAVVIPMALARRKS